MPRSALKGPNKCGILSPPNRSRCLTSKPAAPTRSGNHCS